jgi:hypothetical protein
MTRRRQSQLNLTSPEPRSNGMFGRCPSCCRTTDYDSHRLSAVFVRYGPVRFKVKRFRLDFFCRILSSDPTTNWPVKNLLPMPANESQVWLGFQNIRLRNGKRVEASQVLHMADPRKFRHPNSSSATIASRSMTCPSPRKV